MAKTITQLPDATVVNGSDELIIQQAGVTKRATKTEVLAGIVNANVDAAAAIAGSKIDPQFVTPASIAVSSSTDPALRLTQTGSANCFTVFDETSDTTPFVIGPSGRVGIQTSAPEQALHVNCDGGNGVLLEITDNGAAGDPMLSLRRNSASPAANDQIGYISFVGNDSAANNQNYAAIYANIISPTSTSEEGSLQFLTTTAGTLSAVATIRANRLGVGTANPTSSIHAEGTSFVAIKSKTSGADSSAAFVLENDARDWRIQVQGSDGDKLYFYDQTATAVRLTIDANGNVSIGDASANAAAILDVDSTTKGFLPPRMTTAQRDAISTPPAGLMIYNTTTNKLNVRTASSWEAVTSS